MHPAFPKLPSPAPATHLAVAAERRRQTVLSGRLAGLRGARSTQPSLACTRESPGSARYIWNHQMHRIWFIWWARYGLWAALGMNKPQKYGIKDLNQYINQYSVNSSKQECIVQNKHSASCGVASPGMPAWLCHCVLTKMPVKNWAILAGF